MHVARNASIVLALGLAVSGAMAGEIQGAYGVPGTVEISAAHLATARRNIGVAVQVGKNTHSKVTVNAPASTAAGFRSTGTPSVGCAMQNGSIANSEVLGQGMSHTAAGFLATAREQTACAQGDGKLR